MKILVFTEGTILMHSSGKDVSREQRVKQVQEKDPTVKVYSSYIPIGNAVKKTSEWFEAGVDLCYLTSRTNKQEIDHIRKVLYIYGFPDAELYYRQQGEGYKDVAEFVLPDVLIEDDCESIGGLNEMTYTHIKEKIKVKVKSIAIKEFGGIDHLPDDPNDLLRF